MRTGIRKTWRSLIRQALTVAKLLARGRRLRYDLTLMLISSLIGALLSLVMPIMAGWLYGTLIPDREPEWLPWLFACLAAVALALAGFEYLRGWLLLHLLTDWDRLLHQRAFSRLLGARPGYLRRRRSRGDWAGRLVGLAETRTAIGPPVLNAVFGLSVGVANVVFMLINQPLLSVVAIGLTVFLAAVSADLTRQQLAASLAVSQLEGRIAGFINSVMANREGLRRAAALRRAATRQRLLFRELQAAYGRGQGAMDNLVTVQAGFALAAPMLLFAVAGFFIERPSPGSFLAFYAAFGQLLFAVLGAVTALTSLAQAAVPIYRVLPLLRAPQENSGADPGPRFSGLALERLTFRYEPDAPPALDRIDFSLAPGEIVVLTGTSGSGKTTLLKLILGLEQPQRGLLRINGQPAGHWNPRALRRLAGVALQASPLFPGTVAANIAGFGELPELLEKTAGVAQLIGFPKAHPLLPDGLATLIDDPLGVPERLRQRIGLARALIGKPSLLLLDEVTNALSPAARDRVLAHIRASGAACLAITHDRGMMAAADRVVLLEAGRIAAAGPYSCLVEEAGPFVRFING